MVYAPSGWYIIYMLLLAAAAAAAAARSQRTVHRRSVLDHLYSNAPALLLSAAAVHVCAKILL